tara:strand:+ start:35367 stop:35468 length:102 start_codon:yes stop_codon:yes gene_type:complete
MITPKEVAKIFKSHKDEFIKKVLEYYEINKKKR